MCSTCIYTAKIICVEGRTFAHVLFQPPPFVLCPAVVDAAHRFMHAQTRVQFRDAEGKVGMRETVPLNTVTSAEEKRHIIGDTFVMVRAR